MAELVEKPPHEELGTVIGEVDDIDGVAESCRDELAGGPGARPGLWVADDESDRSACRSHARANHIAEMLDVGSRDPDIAELTTGDLDVVGDSTGEVGVDRLLVAALVVRYQIGALAERE